MKRGLLLLLLFGAAGRILMAAQGLPCESCHGVKGPRWVTAPVCQSCHTGTALRNNGQIRFDTAFEAGGGVRQAVDTTFGVSAPARYTVATGHGGLKCVICHGEPHQDPHMKLLVECSACHQTPPHTTEGGPHGMHPIGEPWVAAHGLAVDETGVAACSKCHGKDGQGTVLSCAKAERKFKTIYGEKHFLPGVQIGCYSCHATSSRAQRGQR